MSAFIVSDEHIQAIVNYAYLTMRYGVYIGATEAILVQNNRDQAERLGQLLIDANYASVNARYRETDVPPKFTFKLTLPLISPTQMLVALRCLDYQSCEVKNWDQTPAYKAILSLTMSTLHDLPEWESCQWEIRQTGVNKDDGGEK